jgi:hypothetical protein
MRSIVVVMALRLYEACGGASLARTPAGKPQARREWPRMAYGQLQVRAVGIAAVFLGAGLAGEPLQPTHVLVAALVVALLTLALERPGTPLQIFAVAFFGVLISAALAHAYIGPAIRPATFAHQFYLNLYPGCGIVGIGLGLLGAASHGRRDAPKVIAAIGAVVGVVLFFFV